MENFAGFMFWVFAFTGLFLAVTKYYRWMWTTLIGSLAIYILSPCLIELWMHIYARVRRRMKAEEKEHDWFVYNVRQANLIPIIYSDHYNMRACGLEKLHPFDAKKYGRTFEGLVDRGVISTFD